MFIVICGLGIVGASDFIFGSGNSSNSLNNIVTGDLLIIMAQIITASQMVWEEKFIMKHNVPALQAVGWEGVFGFFTLSLLLIPMYYTRVGPPFSSNPRMVLEDALDGFTQMGNNPIIMVAMTGNIYRMNGILVQSFYYTCQFTNINCRYSYQHCILQLCWCQCDEGVVCDDTNGVRQCAHPCHLDCELVTQLAVFLLATGEI